MHKVKKKAVFLFMVKAEKRNLVFSKIEELEDEPDSGRQISDLFYNLV